MTHIFSFRIQVIKNNIRIAFMTSCENYDLANLRKLFEKFFGMRSDIDSCINDFPSRKSYFKRNIMRKTKIFITMN